MYDEVLIHRIDEVGKNIAELIAGYDDYEGDDVADILANVVAHAFDYIYPNNSHQTIVEVVKPGILGVNRWITNTVWPQAGDMNTSDGLGA